MSGFERRGRWNVPEKLTTFALWGGGVVDLRYADVATRDPGAGLVIRSALSGASNDVEPAGVAHRVGLGQDGSQPGFQLTQRNGKRPPRLRATHAPQRNTQ